MELLTTRTQDEAVCAQPSVQEGLVRELPRPEGVLFMYYYVG